MNDLGALIEPVARLVWGDPRPGGTPTETRFGDGRTISTAKGAWWVHGMDVGGGVLDLLAYVLGLKGRAAFDWLREHGFDVGEAAGAAPVNNDNKEAPWRPVAQWDYTDENGVVLYRVIRTENGTMRAGKPAKRYVQKTPDGQGGWIAGLNGQPTTLYRLPELKQSIADGEVVFIVEGEKCVDRLYELGIPATTNSGGSSQWRAEFAEHFKGADVVVLSDNDEVGRKHGEAVVSSLLEVAKRVRMPALPDLPPKGDVVDWLDAGGTLTGLYDIANASRALTEAPYTSPFGAVRFRDLSTATITRRWLIKGVMTQGERTILAGPSGSGKTFVAINVGLAIARGEPWQGKKVAPGLVLYQAGEGGPGVELRALAYRQAHGIEPDNDIPFVILPKRIDLFATDEDTDKLIAEAQHWQSVYKTAPLRLLVIDTFSTATPAADENSAKDMSAVLDRASRLSESLKCAVMLVHHMNADGNKVRGHTSIFANVDTVLVCERLEEMDEDGRSIRKIVAKKVKDGVDGQEWRYVLKSIHLGFDEDNEEIDSCVCVHPKGELPPETGGHPLTEAQFTAWINLSNAMSEFAVDRKAVAGSIPPDLPASIHRFLLKEDAERYHRQKYGSGKSERKDTEENTARRTVSRYCERLLPLGYIGSHNGVIWFTGKQPPTPSATRPTPYERRQK